MRDREAARPRRPLLRAAAVWFLLVAAAIFNGTLRVGLLAPAAGERAAHLLSTLLLCVLLLLIARMTMGWIRAGGHVRWTGIGALWLAMTLAFEFLAGHFLFGAGWDRLLADYDIAAGRIWILVLLTTFLAPRVAGPDFPRP